MHADQVLEKLTKHCSSSFLVGVFIRYTIPE